MNQQIIDPFAEASLDQMKLVMARHVQALHDKLALEGPSSHPLYNDKTRLSYWFPLIRKAGLPVPQTEIIPTGLMENRAMLQSLLDHGKKDTNFESLQRRIVSAAKRLTANRLGCPFFLRTDHTSAKHDWKDSCFVSGGSKLDKHICQIIEYSLEAGIMGLPTQNWVVREMLNTKPMFTAFSGDMPIVREFRFFVQDGQVEHWQGYWPPDAIQKPNVSNWNELIQQANRITPDEMGMLTSLCIQANKVVPGYWSIDFLETIDRGWVLTDMAEGEVSYKWGDNEQVAP